MSERCPIAPDRGAAQKAGGLRQIGVVLLLLAPGLRAQTAGLTLEEVLARLSANDKTRTATLKQYSSERRYTLRNHRFGTSAELGLRMQFRQPGAKTFEIVSQSGSRVIRERVLKRIVKAELEAARPEIQAATTISSRNYSFRLLTTETLAGRRCYVLETIPRVPNKYLFRGRVWIDGEDFAVSRIEGSPALNPSFWVKRTTFVHEYRKFDSFWLPVSNRSTTEVRLFGRTEVGVDYFGYRINERDTGTKITEGPERVTLDGVGSAADDWHVQSTHGKHDGQR